MAGGAGGLAATGRPDAVNKAKGDCNEAVTGSRAGAATDPVQLEVETPLRRLGPRGPINSLPLRMTELLQLQQQHQQHQHLAACWCWCCCSTRQHLLL